jgi:hypothetical protein
MGEMTAHSARATCLRQLSVSLPARWEKSESRRNNKHKKSPKKKSLKVAVQLEKKKNRKEVRRAHRSEE